MRKILLLLLLTSVLIFSCSIKEESIYVLPKNYTGYIAVIYDQDNGAEESFQGKKRVYDIPSNGIFKTKFKVDYGISNFPEFYYETIEEKNKIPFVSDFDKIPNDKVVCYGGVTGKANVDPRGKEFISFTNYFVGNKQQIEKATKKVKLLDYIELSKSN